MKAKTTAVALLTVFLVSSVAAQTSQTRSTTNLQATFINSDPTPLQSGEDGDLRFKITNTGDIEAEDVEVQLINNYPFEVKPDRKRNYSLGNLAPGQEYHISTEVLVAEDAPDGSNNFRIKTTHGDFSVTKNIPVEVQSEDIELNLANLQTQPQQLMPDTDNNQLSIDVVNNGEKTAENVVLNLDTPDFFEQTSSFSTRQALGNIPPGEIRTASFVSDINETAPKGSTTLESSISYSSGDSSSEITEENSFNLYLEGKPQFQITNIESDLRTGSSGELRFEVENTGAVESSSTRVRVMDSSDQPFTYSSSSQYIGTLEPGQTGSAVFEVDTESDAVAKDYLLDFEVRGVKNTEVFVEDSTVQTTVENGQDSGTPLAPAILVLALALSGLGYYFRDRVSSALP